MLATTTASLTGGVLDLTDTTGVDDAFAVVLNAPNLEFTNTGSGASIDFAGVAGASPITNGFSVSAGSVTSLVVNGGDGDDQFVIDFSGGNFAAPLTGIRFNGGETVESGGDSLLMTGGGVFAQVIHTLGNIGGGDAFNGTIEVTDNATITYTGLEPITDNLDANNRVFHLPEGTANTAAVLSDEGAASDNSNQLTGSTFEDVTFTTPNNSLTIHLGDMGDTLELQDLDDQFDVALTVLGGAGTDEVEVAGPVTTAAGVITIGTIANPVDTIAFETGSRLANTTTVNLYASGSITEATASTNFKIDAVTLNAVAGGAFGAAAANAAIDTRVANLNVDTSAGNAGQWIAEVNALSSLNLNAGAGNVTLTTGGTLQDTDGATDITATAASITVTSGNLGAGANPIGTSVNSLTTNTSAANFPQWIAEADGLTALNLNAGSGNITLTTGGTILDGDAATDVTATQFSVTLSTGNFGASGGGNNSIDTAVTQLTVNTTGGNGSQWIDEADALTALNLSAGSGNVVLVAGSSVTDGDGATDIAATSATVTAVGSFGSGATAINTSVANLTVTTTGGPGSQWIAESDGLTSLDLDAAGNVTLSAGGSILDADASADVTALQASVTLSAGNFGSGASAIDTDVNSLTVDTSTAGGSQWIDELNGLTQVALNAGTGNVVLGTGGTVTDGDGAVDITATTATLTVANGNFGSVATAIDTSVANLNVDTSGGNGSQWIDETNGLSTLDLDAGSGNVTLTTGGTVLDGDAGTDIQAVTFTGMFGGSFGASGGGNNSIDTNVANLNVDTSGANGSQWIDEANGLASINLDAGSGNVILTAGGEIADSDGSDDVTATGAALTASGGIGSATALDTSVSILAASNAISGNIQIDNNVSGLLTIGTVTPLVGITNTASGGIVDVSNASPLTVADDVSAAGDVTLTASESAATGDDLTIPATDTATTGTVEITATVSGDILLEAGDDFSLAATATLTATSGTITLTSIDTAIDTASSMFTVASDFDAVTAIFNGSTVNDPANGDVFNLTPDQDTGDVLTPFQVNGNDPTVLPGDKMTLDVTGLTGVGLVVGQNPSDGQYTFSNAASVTFDSIEMVNTSPSGVPVNLVVDLGNPLFNPAPDGMTNRLEVQLNATGTMLELIFTNGGGMPVTIFTGDDDPINSLTVLGTTDPDEVVFNTNVNGQLPTEGGGFAGAGTLPAPRKPLSSAFLASGLTPNVPDPPVIYVDGGAGMATDTIIFDLTANGSTTARDLAYFSDANMSFGAENGDINVAPEGGALVGLTMTFANIDANDFVGAAGSTLLADATSTPDTTMITIDDDGMPMDGTSIMTGDGGFTDTSFAGFDSVTVRGGPGPEDIDLVALDVTTPPTAFTIDGDNTTNDDTANDTLQVRSTPAGVAVTMLGGLGSDNFWLFDQNTGGSAANTVDGIQGTVSVSPAGTDNAPAGGDTDSLLIVDRADVTGGGDVVTINATTIDGLFDMGSGTDITYDPDQLDHVTLIASGEDDTLTVDFMGTGGSDLDSVTINGSGGSDRFVVASATASGVTTTLDGDENVGGAPNTGANDDLLDLSLLGSPRTVNLTGHSPIDGYAGNEAAIQGMGSGFTNIDAVQAPAGDGDTLVMDIAGDRTHWDIGGTVSGYGPFGQSMTTLADSLANTGVLISDDVTLSETGNDSTIGRPTGADPITPMGSEDDLAWAGFENLTGAASADDRFDLRDGASITGTIDGRGESADGNGDSLDYRDWTSSVVVNLGSPEQTARSATNVGDIAVGGMGDVGNSIENVFGGNADDTITGDDDDNILGDGHGSDVLDGGWDDGDPPVSGDDVFRLEPGLNEDGTGDSTDVVTDLNGTDTVDFRFADDRVMIDMDLLDTPQDALFETTGTQFVTLMRRGEHDPLGPSMFENVIGSQFDDIIDLDPLTLDGNFPQGGPPTLRHVDGNNPPGPSLDGGPADANPPGDEWHFNAGGQTTYDTGFSISAAGLGAVTYASIETLKLFNTTPRIVDDGDDDFTETPTHAGGNVAFFGNWNVLRDEAGYEGDFRFNHADTESGEVGGDDTATWNFYGVTPGMYRISVSFPDPATSPQLVDVASDAEYTIRDNGEIIARVDVDQRTGARDFQDQGVWWEDLGVFDVRSHTLLVRLRDRADGMVLADAVRIERVNVTPEGAMSLLSPSTGGEITVLDGTRLVLDAADHVAMVTNITDSLAKTFVIRNDGDGPLRIDDILLEPSDANPATNYTLVKPAGLSPATPLMIAPGDSTFFTLTLDATTANEQGDFPAQIRIFSNDYDENVVQKPGTTGIADPTDMNDPPNDVDPFTIDIRGVVTDDWIVDNGDNEFSVVGVWTASASGFQGDQVRAPGDGTGDRARWEFTGLPNGVYRVSATWAGSTNTVPSSQTPFTVSTAGGVVNSVTIDQTVLPNDFSDEGVMWEDLGGPITLTDGTIVVNLLDTANQPSRSVMADAIRIERLYSNAATTPPHVTTFPDIAVEVNAMDVADDTGTVDFGATFPGTPITQTITVRNVGGADLIVEQPVRLPSGYTLVSFDGVPAPDGVTAATIAPAGMMEIVVRMEAGLPGTPGGEISFATNDPDENTFNFATVGTIRSSQRIDNQDGAPAYTNTGGFQLFTNNSQGYNDRVHFAAGDSSGDTATWTFAGVTPGRLYIVSASWTPDPNRATDAPYSIAGVTAPATIDVNQRVAPQGLRVNGHDFQELGVFTADGSATLTVTLSDAANGVVIADVVRIEPVERPEILVSQGGNLLIDGAGTVDFGSTQVGSPVDQTLTITNLGSRALALGTPQLPDGFSLVGAFPNSVSAGSSAMFTVRFDAAAAGDFGGPLSFAGDELNENPFDILLNADAYSLSTTIIDDGGMGFMSTAPFTTMGGGFMGDYQQAAVSPPAASGAATWTFAVSPLTQYRISATWIAGNDRATNATYSFGGVMTGPTGSVENQRVTPNDFSDAGAAWEDLGIITTDGSGTLTVSLPNDTTGLNGLVIADAVRIEPLLIINNEDPAPHYASTQDFFMFGDQGRRGSMQAAASNAPASSATFTFANLTPGSTYRVSATWPESGNRATDAPFTISGVEGGPFVVDINQELAPDDYTAENSAWQDLGGPYTVDGGGTITIALTNTGADEFVVADAIRLQPLAAQPEISVADSSMADVSDGGTFNFASTFVGTPLTETFTIANDGSTNLLLDNASLVAALDQVPQFELVSGFSTTTVPPGMTSTFEVRMLADLPGSPTATIRFDNNDGDENPFEITLTGTVVLPSTIIDDGNAGFVEGGSNLPLESFAGQGFMNDVRQIAAGSDNTAAYTFTGLTMGATYEVAATWTAGGSRAAAAPLTVMGALGGDVDFSINQQVAPGDLTEQGTQFDVIGRFRTTGTTLTVVWSAATTGVVIADAVRVTEVLSPGPEIQVTGSPNVANGDTVDIGSGTQGATLSKTFTITNQGGSNLELAGQILLPTGFALGAVSPAGLFGGGTTTIPADGAPATFEILVDTSTTGMKSGKIEFGTNDTDENSFQINLTANVLSSVQIIDNDGPTSPPPLAGAYTDSGNLGLWGGQGFQNDVREAVAGGAVETATYTFTVTPGVYSLAATWTAFGNRATAAPYAIYDGNAGGTLLATVNVNQRQAPNDFADAGVNWEDLGTFTASGTTLTVVLSGSTTGNVIADAVRLESVFGPEIEVSQDGTPIVDGTTTFDFGTGLVGSTFRKTFTIENAGVDNLEIAPNLVLPLGFTLVPAADPADPPTPATLFDGMTTTVIAPGGSGTFTVQVDTTSATSLSGSLSFGNNDANESPFNFTIAADVAASIIIDDGDPAPGYADTANMTIWPQGFQGDVREAVVGGAAQGATYTFDGLPSGTYRVSATWTAYFNRASNAQYVINGGSPILVNQKLTPNNPLATVLGTSVLDSGTYFADLSVTASPVSGMITVGVSDTASNGNVIIDAIRIERLGPLHAAPGSESVGRATASSILATADVLPLLDAAIGYWTLVDPSAASRLQNVQVRVTDLPGSILGLGSFTSPNIWLDVNGAGRGWDLTAVAPTPSSSATDGMDLLSVVTHELGHVLGYPDLDPAAHPDHVMTGSLAAGRRAVDDVFAAWEPQDDWLDLGIE